MPDHAPHAGPEEMASHLAAPLESLADPLAVPTLRSVIGDDRFDVTLRPPGSKSLTNRALLLAALARGRSELRGALTDATDTRVMIAALRTLGAEIEVDAGVMRVSGVGGRWSPAGGSEVTLDLENAGTATRFLAAASVLSPAPIIITGNARMRARPIGELAGALGDLGARIESLETPGCPPIRVTPPADVPERGQVFFDELPSSQFVSAVLMLGAFLPGGLAVEIDGEVTSASYVRMTMGLLDALGVSVRSSADLRVLRVASRGGAIDGFELDIEPDASGASVFWAAAASSPGSRVTMAGVDESGLQGDVGFPSVLARMGAEVTSVSADDSPSGSKLGVRGGATIMPVMADMRDMPDAAMALVVLAALAKGGSMIRGLHTLRVKETDRLQALKTELARVGVDVELDVHGEDGAVRVEPPTGGLDRSESAPAVVFETYDDHRMAMALSLIALHRPNVSIADPGCVRKTYPGFWAELAKVYQ
ncbi:MAG: 3-phosphoshikimate 1-carboxyvinyltransferase [Phycisphaerales bacterium]